MKTISTYAHGVLDYLFGIILIIAPNIFHFAQSGPPAVVARVIGIIIIVQALITNYELGVFKVLPMRAHLFVDYVLSIFLAISPWLFHFNNQPSNVWLPHLVIGVLAYLVTLMT